MESKLTRLAFYGTATGGSYLLLSDLQNAIDKTIEGFPENNDFPLGVVGIFETGNIVDSKLLTDWLIQYFETKQENKVVDSILQSQPAYLDQQEVLADGVYFWPKLFKIKDHNTEQLILCLILHIQGTNRINYEFAASACSTAICVSQDNMDLFKSITSTWRNMEKTANAIHFPIDEGYTSLKNYNSNKDEIQMKKIFFETIDKYPLSTKVTSLNETITVSTFIPYLRMVRKMIQENSQLILSNEFPTSNNAINLFGCSNETFEQVNQENTSDTNTAQDSNDFAKKTTAHGRVQHSQTQSRLLKANSVCEKLFCTDFQNLVLSGVLDWLKSQNGLWPLIELMRHLLQFKQYDNHDHFLELGLAFKAIGAYLGELQNIFQSHICFYGRQNMDIFNCASKNAYKNSLKVLLQPELVHYDFVHNFQYKACISLHSHFLEDNLLICEYEVELAKYVSNVIVEQYEIELRKHFENSNVKPQIVKGVNSRLQRYAVRLLKNCLESDNRVNNVETKINGKMQELMHQTYKQLEIEFLLRQFPQEQDAYGFSMNMYQNVLRKV